MTDARRWLIRLRRIAALAALSLAGVAAAGSEAAELYVDGRLRQGFEYDSNIELTDDGDDGAGSRSRVGATLGTRTPAVDLALDGEVTIVRFFDRSDLDSEDYRVQGRGAWKWRRADLNLRAGVVRDTTREILDTETGRFAGNNLERLTVDATSALSYLASPIDTAGLSLLYRRRLLPDGGQARDVGLEEFSFYSLDTSWLRRLNPAVAARAVVGTSYFDSDREESVAVQGRLGGQYRLTPALKLDGTLGPTVVLSDRNQPSGGSDTEFGFLWNAAVDYQPSADTEVLTRFFQELDPQSEGGALDFRTGLEVELEYQLTRYTSVGLAVVVQRQDPINGNDVADDSRWFARVGPTLAFQLTPQLRLETSYRFRWQDFDDDGAATSNGVFLDLNYDLPSLLSSR